ncbi:MAG TPA: acyl-phosphate glycerol 3-phosphate acyltransferase [Candidatus Omnitrophica bacterium]|nr:acyl-phosphate glycerol 3-phosphate acyltransferase [Candidatus Omnitrophota bacterium]
MHAIIISKLLPGLLISYLFGSIPTAYLFGKIARGIDLRQHGSGNLGATNAFRVLGKGIGTAVLSIDIFKGTAAVLAASFFFYSHNTAISRYLYVCLAAITAVAGHNWTIFLGFKGGKGIATSLGTLIAFSVIIPGFIKVVLIIIFMWLLTFLSTGFVSLASVICSISLPGFAIIFNLPKEITAFLLILAIFSVIKHKSNISRLLQKKENRFNTRSFLKKLSK